MRPAPSAGNGYVGRRRDHVHRGKSAGGPRCRRIPTVDTVPSAPSAPCPPWIRSPRRLPHLVHRGYGPVGASRTLSTVDTVPSATSRTLSTRCDGHPAISRTSSPPRCPGNPDNERSRFQCSGKLVGSRAVPGDRHPAGARTSTRKPSTPTSSSCSPPALLPLPHPRLHRRHGSGVLLNTHPRAGCRTLDRPFQ
ncbi:Hypothetical protein CAP_3152 [Chondromyces apiculatus DSM 436]|uniref:Uncharacterized protein n=1 Tax=Chondromyces apiculatus DSM 436 TaxID=1192034 RepID=A0A017T8Q6_9BACT|nr:Hypothetical protein CAP_3152 [Chondromyces apiculatus DSM 436]